MSTPPQVVDVNYELFWRQVGEAVAMVEADNNKQLTIKLGTRQADISYAEWETTEPPYSGIQIEIYEVEPDKKEPLIAP